MAKPENRQEQKRWFSGILLKAPLSAMCSSLYAQALSIKHQYFILQPFDFTGLYVMNCCAGELNLMNLAQLMGCFHLEHMQSCINMVTKPVQIKIGPLKPNFIQIFPCFSNTVICYNSVQKIRIDILNHVFEIMFLKIHSLLLTIFN